ncbi:2-dehydro-3-deoxygalactonokinase [Flammeovirga pacifica]|uniref:2-keto-3-deoxy-galactonokinase n=1 Tax=Flammeovirga pacifica TaxID=915059 RepID=A0A1S1YS77_FLAPC|nr:2-dehydro-3-deoxygalactonokinase [Flammeovirga pacifica]OHX63881.1 hypothetical protein NH26_19915 [Flammeovirga pacifica]
MKHPKYFVSCDWGTSNFRIRLIAFDSLEVIKEHKTDQGVKKLYQEFLSSGNEDREGFFSEYLLSQLIYITDVNQPLYIIACGMVTSTMGLKEMEYAPMPINDDVNTLNVERLQLRNDIELILISGVKTTNDVMRGEEVQAIGLTKYLDKNAHLLLPGTHSKHLVYKEGRYVDFTTYMTGEMFDLISNQTIIKDFLKSAKMESLQEDAFIDGVKDGSNGKFLGSLFPLRAKWVSKSPLEQKQLIDKQKDQEMFTANYYYLSGLLIGTELTHLKDTTIPVVMAASGILFNLYQLALKTLEVKNFRCLDGTVLEHSMIQGQQSILQKYLENELLFNG